jgi:hypothetical protein
MLWANPYLAAMVPVGNRIDYTDNDRDPTKSSMQAADFPQVSIEASDGVLHLFRTSNGTSVTVKYQVLVLTGDKRLNYLNTAGTSYVGLLPLMWEILRALSTWETHLMSLNWGAETGFVKKCDLTLHKENLDDKKQDTPKRKDGWVVAWEGEVEMWFSSLALPHTS